jgi:plasmid stabilization system protein ParE
MKRFHVTPAARSDLREISDYIESHSPAAAKRVRAKLREAMHKLGQSPGIGHFREDLADEPIRFWSVYSYLIVYRTEPRPIEILRVIHGARDLKSILKGKLAEESGQFDGGL